MTTLQLIVTLTILNKATMIIARFTIFRLFSVSGPNCYALILFGKGFRANEPAHIYKDDAHRLANGLMHEQIRGIP